MKSVGIVLSVALDFGWRSSNDMSSGMYLVIGDDVIMINTQWSLPKVKPVGTVFILHAITVGVYMLCCC